VDVAWYTYAIGGLSRNDFIMAARLSEWLRSRQGANL
jgi:4a-hydroxytetrahydrobiopterin dehydratase